MNAKFLTAVLCCSLLVGCHLVPKKVEFFQKDVPRFPVKAAPQKETEKQTAALLAEKAHQTEFAAQAADSPESVQKPASETAELAEALTISLGPPQNPWKGDIEALSARLIAQEARRDAKLDRLEEKLSRIEGKDVEGTGKIQMPYFLYVALVGGAIVVTLFLVRVGVGIAAMFHPAAALAKAGLDIPLKGFAQVVQGGGKFVTSLPRLNLGKKVEGEIKDLFLRCQKEAQNEEIKQAIKRLPGGVRA